jgi:hypothetical protein
MKKLSLALIATLSLSGYVCAMEEQDVPDTQDRLADTGATAQMADDELSESDASCVQERMQGMEKRFDGFRKRCNTLPAHKSSVRRLKERKEKEQKEQKEQEEKEMVQAVMLDVQVGHRTLELKIDQLKAELHRSTLLNALTTCGSILGLALYALQVYTC